MKSFVNIKTLYNAPSERTIQNLSSIYNNTEYLYGEIRNLFLAGVNVGHIRNKRVLLKPNLVCHDRCTTDEICLRTDWHFILATVRVVCEYQPDRLILGDAPVQGCDWGRMTPEWFTDELQKISRQFSVSIDYIDFRKLRLKGDRVEHISQGKDFILFDVGIHSMLEPITSSNNVFRVGMYNPDRMAQAHKKGMHKYCITKEVFDCDTIITIPKIKTHQKAGLTNSLKIFVGINGDKDFLPHHRIGAVGHGGDCYKGYHPFRRISELLLDEANRNIGKNKKKYKSFLFVSRVFWKLSFPNDEQSLGAGWYGNDTVWRMVIDLNRIVEYGRKNGTLADVPQRNIYTLCDGIIAGQGDGPLNPEPLPLGIIALSNDAFLMDEIATILFRLNYKKIPLINYAHNLNEEKDCIILINGNEVNIEKVKDFSLSVKMPPGWVNYNDRKH